MKEFLKKRRLDANLTQKQVAKKLELETSQYISNFENGKSLPSPKILRKLSNIYDCDLLQMKKFYYFASLEKHKKMLLNRLNINDSEITQ